MTRSTHRPTEDPSTEDPSTEDPLADDALAEDALADLCRRDRPLALVRARLGDPPNWRRPQGLDTLCHIILEQQVSLASALATLVKLRDHAAGPLTSDAILDMSPDTLRACGVSRQKARYLSALAADVRDGHFDIDGLSRLPDDAVRDQITSRLGLGRWSADIYLIMALGRSDVFPVGDLALVKGMSELDGGKYPDEASVMRRGDAWRPHRTLATKLIWSLYLHNRDRLTPRSPNVHFSVLSS